MKRITVTVSGMPSSGKSAIAQQIAGQLQAINIPATLNFINDEHPARTNEDHQSALQSLRDAGITVEVNEKNTAKSQ